MNFKIQKIGIGSVQFGFNYGISNSDGEVTEDQVGQILRLCKQYGISTIDTASQYGTAELKLGESMGEDAFQVVTKISSKVDLNVQFKESLRKLKVSKVYALLLHDSASLLEYKSEEIWKVLKSFQDMGLVSKVGASFYDPEVGLAVSNKHDLDIVQVPFNIFDQRFLKTSVLEKFKEKNIEVHTRSAFLQGLLLMEKEKIHPYFSFSKELLEIFYKFSSGAGFDKIGALLNLTLNSEFVDRTIVGITSTVELLQIINSVKTNCCFSNDQLKVLSSEDVRLINPSNWKV